MKNRSILIITPFFAPQSHAAVFRAHKLAKYLSRSGWKVHVLTVKQNYLYNEDLNLEKELPNVIIHRINYIEPSLRGLRSLFLKRNDEFAAVKKVAKSEDFKLHGPSSSKIRNLYRWILENISYNPDSHWTWVSSAVKKAKEIMSDHDIDLFLTSCVPYSSNVIGQRLKNSGYKWVADFRDAPTYCHRTFSKNQRIFSNQRRIERRTLFGADATTGLSSAYPLIFNDMYDLPNDKQMTFIPTGVDDDYLLKDGFQEASTEKYFVFVGEYLKEYKDSFLQVLAGAQKNESFRRMNVKVKIIGNKQINEYYLNPYLDRHGLKNSIEIVDHLPQLELYKIIRKSLACLLIPGERHYWWTSFAKLADYVCLQKPVIAIIPNPSEARAVLEKCGLGVFLIGSIEEKASTLVAATLAGFSECKSNENECQKYLASQMTHSFISVFENILGNE